MRSIPSGSFLFAHLRERECVSFLRGIISLIVSNKVGFERLAFLCFIYHHPVLSIMFACFHNSLKDAMRAKFNIVQRVDDMVSFDDVVK